MSWSFQVPATRKGEQFDAAVDAAESSGQDVSLPGVAEDVEVAKKCLKILSRQVKRDLVAGGASGHCLQEGESSGMSDSLGVNVYGSDAQKAEGQ